MIDNMLKLNKKMVQNRNYYHTCPACRINIFNADFRIFLYNRAGNKTDEICARSVLTEAASPGCQPLFSGLRTDRSVCSSPFAQPGLEPAGDSRVPLLSSPPLSPWSGLSSGLRGSGRALSKFRKPGASRPPWRLLGTTPRRLPTWREVAPGPPTPRLSGWARV